MELSDFDYELPEHLIARYPAHRRTGSRMLEVDPGSGKLTDLAFTDLASRLDAGDLLVLNDTRVIPARLYGRKSTGGSVEVMVERLLDTDSALVQTRASKPVRAGQRIAVDAGEPVELEVVAAQDSFRVLRRTDGGSFLALLERAGHVPLPPYIERPDEEMDRERYQSVFAREPGAVAAPTASLHFDEPYLDAVRDRGVRLAWMTLHVGAGTFQPLRSRDIDSHRLHREWTRVPTDTADAVTETRRRGGRVVAVGTTVCRALESWAGAGCPPEFQGETDLFIMPGFSFSVVDALLTNFHLPRSSLLMLVCAFAGTRPTLAAYRHAVHRRYRFYSYGDAMFIPARGEATDV
ncbi:MAG: tRNA preQ1(34) S-adenosylmethionine ribosyltransferase-isomerase QueA [Gammaproteobacteria bacterium]|nr:tRNA preQ1(34) S-adenosylmethionine ribosyltransferase-isomerase QueA [Gammaproteobacteria bacterium]